MRLPVPSSPRHAQGAFPEILTAHTIELYCTARHTDLVSAMWWGISQEMACTLACHYMHEGKEMYEKARRCMKGTVGVALASCSFLFHSIFHQCISFITCLCS